MGTGTCGAGRVVPGADWERESFCAEAGACCGCASTGAQEAAAIPRAVSAATEYHGKRAPERLWRGREELSGTAGAAASRSGTLRWGHENKGFTETSGRRFEDTLHGILPREKRVSGIVGTTRKVFQ
jgi:hypothetical protein